MVTGRQIDDARPAIVIGMANQWISAAKKMVNHADTYVGYIEHPGGGNAPHWEGATAAAAADMAHSDRKAIVQTGQALTAMANTAITSMNDSVIPVLTAVRAMIDSAEQKAYRVADDLTITWAGGPVAADKIKDMQDVCAELTKKLRQAAQVWWDADQQVADQIDTDKVDLNNNFNAVAALSSQEGKSDGDALAARKMSPQQLERLKAAAHLSPDELQALKDGKDVAVGSGRMAYLYRLAQSLNDKEPAEIEAIKQSLPEETRPAFANALAIISNPHALSGVPNTDGATGSTSDSFIPRAGSVSNLPTGMFRELTRKDRVVNTPASVEVATEGFVQIPARTQLNGVGAMQEIADIFKDASPGYTNGSEATRAMLQASSEYANADAQHREELKNGSTLSPSHQLFSDHHGNNNQPGQNNVNNALSDVVDIAGRDHTSVHDLATGPMRDSFLHGMTQEHWDDKSQAVGNAFQWMGDEPKNPMNAETANSVAHYLSENLSHSGGKDMQHLLGGDTFGSANPQLAQSFATGLSPYLGPLAGAGDDVFSTPGIKHVDNQQQMADLFAVLDQDHGAGVTINNAAIQHQHLLQSDAAQHGVSHYGNVEIAERLRSAMNDGAHSAQEFDQASKQVGAATQDGNMGRLWDTGFGALSGVTSVVPGGQIPAAVEGVLNPIFRDAYLQPADPTTLQGDDYIVKHLSSENFNNATVDNATPPKKSNPGGYLLPMSTT